MANKQISDLQARTFDGDSIIAHDVENTDPSTMSQKPYLTGSATGHAVADFVGNGEIYTSDLNTVDKHINGAINELHTINGYSYDAYDDNATYAVGDLCIYNNALYKCTTAITTAEAWNASHWTATNIADEINALNTGLSGVETYRCKYDYTPWGSSKGSEYTHVPFFRIQIDLDYYIASNGGNYINIRNLRTGTTQSSQIPSGQTSVSVTVDGYTFTKNVSDGKQNIVITTTSNKPIFIEYYL